MQGLGTKMSQIHPVLWHDMVVAMDVESRLHPQPHKDSTMEE